MTFAIKPTLMTRATARRHSITRHIASIMPKAGLFEVALTFVLESASAQSATDTLAIQRETEARAAIAEAEHAELMARLPPSTSKPLPGSIETKQFGAAGLVKAFDLARQLASEVCAILPDKPNTAVYEPTTAQGILAARLVADSIERLGDDLGKRNKELQQIVEAHTPQGTQASAIAFTALTCWSSISTCGSKA